MASGTVHTGPYQAGGDQSKVMPASTLQLEAGDAAAAMPVDTTLSGEELYRQGIDALTAQNKQRAMDLFAAAWRKEAEMDPLTRAQLKDKLTLLSQNQKGGSEAVAAQEVPPAMQAVSQEQALLRQKMFREVTTEIAEAERMVNDQRCKLWTD